MGKNRLFFPQEALDAWVISGVVELQGEDLVMKERARRYRLTEGARIVREVSGAPDDSELVGRCKTLFFLRQLGADILERSMIVGENAYDIVPGFLGAHVFGQETRDEPALRETELSDDELLAQFLAKNM
ncbi:MAG: hypothetical protein MUF54_16270 [Polyangiaceae bacterium]|jgi:hypothetical protein|nr:hypothetical protein [Polyangiaceae bacterium]